MKGWTLSSTPSPPTPSGGGLPEGFLFGVATAGFQVEGGYNGPGQPANNWLAWEQVGRVEPSGNGVGFFDRPDEALDRAQAIGCDSFRLGVEWARVVPDAESTDSTALARYALIVDECAARGLVPLVTMHHFTHPDWLGVDFWLRPDAPDRFLQWAEVVVEALAPAVRHWVTLNEINVLALNSWVLGVFPPGRFLSIPDQAIALDNLLTAHVLGYEVIHRARPDAVVTTNNACLSPYGQDRMLTDLLLARGAGVDRDDVDDWLEERRHRHDRLLPAAGLGERFLRGASRGHWPATGPRRDADAPERASRAGRSTPSTRVPHERTLDVVAIDYYDPRGRPPLPAPGPPDRRWTGRPARPRALGRRPRAGRPHPLVVGPALPGPRGPALGGGERPVQPGAPRALVPPPRRLGPSARTCGRTSPR